MQALFYSTLADQIVAGEVKVMIAFGNCFV